MMTIKHSYATIENKYSVSTHDAGTDYESAFSVTVRRQSSISAHGFAPCTCNDQYTLTAEPNSEDVGTISISLNDSDEDAYMTIPLDNVDDIINAIIKARDLVQALKNRPETPTDDDGDSIPEDAFHCDACGRPMTKAHSECGTCLMRLNSGSIPAPLKSIRDVFADGYIADRRPYDDRSSDEIREEAYEIFDETMNTYVSTPATKSDEVESDSNDNGERVHSDGNPDTSDEDKGPTVAGDDHATVTHDDDWTPVFDGFMELTSGTVDTRMLGSMNEEQQTPNRLVLQELVDTVLEANDRTYDRQADMKAKRLIGELVSESKEYWSDLLSPTGLSGHVDVDYEGLLVPYVVCMMLDRWDKDDEHMQLVIDHLVNRYDTLDDHALGALFDIVDDHVRSWRAVDRLETFDEDYVITQLEPDDGEYNILMSVRKALELVSHFAYHII